MLINNHINQNHITIKPLIKYAIVRIYETNCCNPINNYQFPSANKSATNKIIKFHNNFIRMITSISEDMAYRKANLQEYEVVMRKINGFVDNINNKIVNRIEKVKQGYLEDYK